MIQSLPQTILMTADTVGGVWNYTLELCRALQPYNIQVHLATMGEFLSESQIKAVGKLTNVEVHESNFALEWMDNPWDEVDKAGSWLIELEQQVQPDLIHLNNYVHGNLDWNAPVLIVAHSCVLSWWKAVKGVEAPEQWNHYTARVTNGLQYADHIVAVSRFMLQEIKNYYEPDAPDCVIYNGRKADHFYSSHKNPIIFSMGRIWDEAKNVAALEQIAASLAWPIEVAGTGSHTSENYFNLTFLGNLSEEKVAEKLSHASIYAMPARYEPFGLSILEAALSGCALVLGNIPSLKEIWGDAALYVDPDKPADLQTKIQMLIQDQMMRKKMAEKAMKRACYYSAERFSSQYIDLYKRLMSKKYKRTVKKLNV